MSVVLGLRLLRCLRTGAVEARKFARHRTLLQDADAVAEVLRLLCTRIERLVIMFAYVWVFAEIWVGKQNEPG